jgi:tripartite-type tricarboxylate transporter receptor subunit TctC
LRERTIHVLVQFGMERAHDLPDVPTLIDLARNETERAVFSFVCSDIPIGKSFVLPPDVPAERVDAIRKAFDATLRDPDFLADAKAADADVDPIPGMDIQALVGRIVATPREIVRTAQDWMTDRTR